MGAGDEGLIETIYVKFQALQESLESLRADSLKANEILKVAREKNKEDEKNSWEVTLLAQQAFQDARLDKAREMALRENQYELEKWSKVRKMLDEATDLSKEKYAAMSQHAEEHMNKARAAIDNIRNGFSELGDKIDQTTQKQKSFLATIGDVGKSVGIDIPSVFTGGAIAAGAFSVLGQGNKFEQSEKIFESMRGRGMTGSEATQYESFMSEMTSTGVGGKYVPQEEAARISQAIMSRGGTTADQAFGPNGLARTALMAAPGAGVSSDRAVEHFNTMMTQLSIPASKVNEEFLKLVGSAQRMGDASGKSIEATMALAKNFTAYNLDIDTAGRIVRNFWQEIKEGKMSMEELNKIIGVGGRMSEGQRAFTGMEILGKDSHFSEIFAGQTGLAAEQITKRILMGNRLIGENIPGTDKEQNKFLNDRRDDAIQAIYSRAKDMGSQFGKNDSEKQALTSKFLQSFSGLNFGNLSPEMEQTLIDDMSKGKGLSKEGARALQQAGMDPTIAGLEKIGEEIRSLGTDPLKKILEELKNIAKLLGGGLVYIAGAITKYIGGDSKAGERMMSQARSIMKNTGAGEALGKSSGKLMSDIGDFYSESGQMEGARSARDGLRKVLSSSHFESPEQFNKIVGGIYSSGGGDAKTLMEKLLAQGSLKAEVGGTFVFDFGKDGKYDIEIKDGKPHAVNQKTGAAKPGMVSAPKG